MNKAFVSTFCQTVKEFCESNQKSDRIIIQIDIKDINPYHSTIKRILSHKKVKINSSNLSFFCQLLLKLKIQELEQKKNNFLAKFSEPIEKSIELQELITYERLIFTLNEETKENNLIEILKILNKNNSEIIAQVFFSRCLVMPQETSFILDFLLLINEKQSEKKARQLLPFFKSIVLRNLRLKIDKNYFYDKFFLQEISFITIWLLEKQIITPEEIIPLHSKLTPFFAHLMSTNTTHFELPFHALNCDWEKHKQNILNGENNSDSIFKVIREDDSKTLIKMTQMLHFNYDQIVPVQYYEKFSILATYFPKVSILDYCAFYGSLECFKLLLNNGTTKMTKNIAIFAAAGGNLEIFKIIDSNDNKKSIQFDNESCLNVAIQFHRQQIIEYLIEYKNISIQDIFNSNSLSTNTKSNFMNIFKTFFQFSNFVALFYIWKRGIDPSLFIEAASSCGFAPAVRFILSQVNNNSEDSDNQNSSFIQEINTRNPLHSACLSGNEETVKLLLQSNLFDINEKIVYNI